MEFSRRDLCLLIPAALASAGIAAEAVEEEVLPSKVYRFEDLPAHRGKTSTGRPILQGKTHGGFSIEMHETDLDPGGSPHPPHHHEHEEAFMMREGELEVTIEGKTTRVGPGSLVFVASNQEHGVKNPGPGHAQYFVIELWGTRA